MKYICRSNQEKTCNKSNFFVSIISVMDMTLPLMSSVSFTKPICLFQNVNLNTMDTTVLRDVVTVKMVFPVILLMAPVQISVTLDGQVLIVMIVSYLHLSNTLKKNYCFGQENLFVAFFWIKKV